MEEKRSSRMGTWPIPKLIMSMSLPIMASMMIQALYNVVDSIFVARVSENALTAVSLAFPIQSLMIAVAVGTAVGINALLSRKLGERNFEDANMVATNGIFISVASSIVFALFGIFGVKAFFSAFTQPGELMDMGIAYTSIVCCFSVGLFVSIAGERLLQATGITIYSMYSQMSGAITNIILDPILIFGWFGLPEMGVAGAAAATVIGQFVSMFVNIWFNFKKNKDIHISFKRFKPSGRIIVEIYRIGLPSIFMQAIGSVMTFGMNKILILFSQTAVSVFGLYFKLQSFIFMPVMGLTSGMIPIIGYNFGARSKDRIIQTIKMAIIMASSIMIFGTALFWILPRFMLVTFFDASETMLSIGVPALRIISIHFVIAATCIVLSSSFQALGRGVNSLVMSFLRQLVVLLPVAWFMGRFISLNAVWFAFPIAECCALVIALTMFKKIYNDQIKNL